MSNWGVIEERDDNGKFVTYHIMPMIQIDGESVVSAAHEMSDACPCHPELQECGDLTAIEGEKDENGKLKRWTMWDHHDADHPGSREHEKTKPPETIQ